jgi:hypothetical protein
MTAYKVVANTLGIDPHVDPRAIVRAGKATAPSVTVYVAKGMLFCVAKRPPDEEGWRLHQDQRFTAQGPGRLWVKDKKGETSAESDD